MVDVKLAWDSCIWASANLEAFLGQNDGCRVAWYRPQSGLWVEVVALVLRRVCRAPIDD